MRKAYRSSLSKRLLWVNAVSILVVAVTLAILVDTLIYDASRDRALNHQQSFTELVAHRIDANLEERTETLKRLVNQLHDGQALHDLDHIQQVLDSRIMLHEFYNHGLMVADAEGYIIADSPALDGRIGLSMHVRDHYQRVRAGETVISPPFIGRTNDEPMFLVHTPIFTDQGDYLGSVFGSILLAQDNLMLDIAKETLGDDGSLYVFDRSLDRVLASSQHDQVLRLVSELDNQALVQALAAGQQNGLIRGHLGEDLVFTSTRLNALDWEVVHLLPSADLLAATRQLIWIISLATLALLLIGAVTSGYFIRRHLRPLESAAKTLAQKTPKETDFNPLPVERDDEVGFLVSEFNQLLEKQNQQSQQLRASKEEAEAASQAKTQFLANMSHEIRTPLNAILGLTELQLEEKMDFKSQQRLEQVVRSGRLLLGIVNDLLDFSKIEAGKLSTEKEPFELDEVARNLVTLFDLPASAKGLELIIHLQPHLPRQLLGDSLRLSQVLTNLAANAIKFTEQGYVEVSISEVSHDKDQLTLKFSVSDTGIGISKAQQQRLFQAFQQADDSITRKHGGTGLGLVISQRLVHLMGGTDIQLHSELGKGTEFSFQLSFEYPDQFDLKTSVPGCQQEVCRALVVDDQPIARQVLAEILHAWGYEVLEAEDGHQAIALVEQELQAGRSFSVILMDWEMPHMNGLSALKQIRNLLDEQPLPVQTPAMLMVSAHDRAEIMEEDDSVPYLPKPIQRSSLYNALNHLQPSLQGGISKEVFCDQQVLVVEDNPINQRVVREQLEQMGLSVQIADNGQEGVDAVAAGGIDLVLMDIQMPVMDGYEAARLIRQHQPDLPIIALTAAALFEDRQKALAAGMNDHLGKPFTGQQLFDQLKPWLETRELRQPSQAVPTEAVKSKTSSVQTSLPRLNQQPSLLIVDDQPANIKVLANQLKEDYRIQVANSGLRALKIARSDTPPDLILLDIMMPDMDGYEVCRELKQDPQTSNLPIIFLSALSETDDEEKGLNLGAVDYITKPFHPAVVRSRIRNHMDLKKKTDLLESMSHIDGLTQVANRRFFDTVLARESSRLARNNRPLGLIMMDIDYFKPFNDNYGHGKGDDCLIKVAQALQSVIKRPGDLLARYGGEEFVVLLPETDSEGVKRVADKLLEVVEQLDYPHAYSKVADHVTLSLGCTSGKLEQQTPDDLLKRADEALYKAKEAGRNRVVYASD